MPTFEITAPDGSVHEVEAPEGATENQALDFFKSQYVPQKKQAEKGDFARGMATYVPGLQETFGGTQVALGAGAKKLLGEGAVSDYLIGHGAQNLKEAEAKQQKIGSKETDTLTGAWQKGIGAVVTDYVPYFLGQAVGNTAEAIGVSAAGAALGGALGGPVAPEAAAAGALAGIVEKQLVKKGIREIADKILKEEGKEAAEKYIKKEAGKIVGSYGGTAAQAIFHGIGETTSRAAEEAQKQGQTVEDLDWSRLGPAAIGHSAADFIANRIGLGSLDGLATPTKSFLLNVAKNAGVTGAKEIPPEVLQSALERYGAGLPLDDKQAIEEYINTAGGAFVMGAVPGGIGGALTTTRVNEQPTQPAATPAAPLAAEPAPAATEPTETQRLNEAQQTDLLGREAVTNPLLWAQGPQAMNAEQAEITKAAEQAKAAYNQEQDLGRIGGKIDQSTPLGMELAKTQEKMEVEAAAAKSLLTPTYQHNFEPTQATTPEAPVSPVVAPSGPPQPTPEMVAKVGELKNTLIPALRRFGLGDVGLKIVDSIENGSADAHYAQKLITLALDTQDHLGAIRHESVHALKQLGAFTPQEWQVLSNKAKSEWVPQFIQPARMKAYQNQYAKENNGNMAGFDEYIQEEAIADAFKHFNNKMPPGLIGNLMYRLKQLFQSLGNTLRGQGFTTGDKIFRGIEESKYGTQTRTEPKFNLRTEEPSGKGIIAEVAPHPEQEIAKKWREMTQPERLNATRAVGNKALVRLFDDMGLKGYHYTFSTGKYQGELNPNVIIEAPKNATPEQLEAVARSVGYLFDQKAMIWFDESDSNGPTFVQIKVPEGMKENDLNNLRSHIESEIPAIDFDTVRGGSIIYANFSEMNDEKFHQAVEDAVSSFDYDGKIEVYEPKSFRSELIEVKNKEEYLEGTKYGNRSEEEVQAGREAVRNNQGNRFISDLAQEAVKLRESWINARSANREPSPAKLNGVSVPTVESQYGTPQEGSVSAVGVHFSKQKRGYLSSQFYGTGIKGAESARLNEPENKAIKDRIFFYVSNGKGIFPEAGVGGHAHTVELNNLYDGAKDELGLLKGITSSRPEERLSEIERRIHDAGFDGYLVNDKGANQAYAVLIGKHDIDMGGKKYSLRAPDTAEFKKWFGDSKVVDENGNPLPLYRGGVGNVDMSDGFLNASPREGYAVFASTSPYVSASYANPEIELSQNSVGAIAPVYVKADKLIEFPVQERNGSRQFDKFAFDKAAQRLKAGEVLVARQVYDYGPRANVKVDPKRLYSYASDIYAWNKGTPVKSAFNQKPTEKEDTRYSLRTPKTDSPEFKKWFGDSITKDAEGKPMVLYHGTAQDITEFKPKQAGAIFVTARPQFAESFSGASEMYMKRELFDTMSMEERRDVFRKALEVSKNDGNVSPKEYSFLKARLNSIDATYNSIPPGIEVEVQDILGDMLPTRANILPVYVKAENPFNYSNKDQVRDVINWLRKNENLDDRSAETLEGRLLRGSWEAIERDAVQRAIKALGHDSFFVLEAGTKNLAVYEPSQIKSATGNIGTYDINNPDIRYSFRNAPPQTTTQQQPHLTTSQSLNSMATSVKAAMTTNRADAVDEFRVNWVDAGAALQRRLENEPIYKDGKLRADLLNRARSQEINLIKNGLTGGMPVLNSDGTIITKEDAVNNYANSQIMADRLNSNQYVKDSGLDGRGYVAEVARALRGEEIQKEDDAYNADPANTEKRNRNKLVSPEQMAWANQQLKNVPELEKIFDIWKNINTSLVNLWEDTGLLDKKAADEFRSKKRYISLAKSFEDMQESMEGRIGFGATGLKSVKKIQKLKGSEQTVNVWENLDKQFAMMVSAAYQNQTRKTAGEQLAAVGAADYTNAGDKNVNFRYKDPTSDKAGKDGMVSMIVHNPMDVAAFEAFHYELNPIIKAMSGATNVLRTGALLNPMFWIKQLIRDPIHAALTNSPIVSPFHSAGEFMRLLMNDSPEGRLLASRGVIGAVDTTVDLQSFLEKAGEKYGGEASGLQKALHKAMAIHEASDAATRVAIFKKAKKDALARGLSEEAAVNEAVYRARESINFSVRGRSQTLNSLRHMTPFLTASIASLDTLYRAATGAGLPAEQKAQAQRMFKQRALMMTMMTVAYAMMLQDDDEYKKLPDYIKDNNWLFPNPMGEGFIKIPVPYEVGFLTKTIPEGAIRYMSGTSTGKEVVKSYLNGLGNSLPGDAVPLPQLMKPAYEVITNHSLFTGSPIESLGESHLPVEQRGRNASQLAKELSGAGLGSIGLSPAKIDHLTQGYFAELGLFSNFVLDKAIYAAKGETPMDKNLAQQPFFKSFLTDPARDKAVSDFYEINHTASQVSAAFNDYKKTGEIEAAKDILADEEKSKLLKAAPALNRIAKSMTTINNQIRIIQNKQDMDSAERLEKVTELQKKLGIVARQHHKILQSAGIEE